MVIRKILVGVDFSDGSKVAVDQGLAVARRHGAELVLVHAGEIPEQGKAHPHAAVPFVEEYEAALRQDFQAGHLRLEELHEQLQAEGANVSQLYVNGPPDEGLCRAAKETGADLLLVGTHGRTGFRRFIMGNYAERILRLSPCDVLVARPEPIPDRGYNRVLVPTDFSPQALPSVELALELATDQASIEVFHSLHVPYTALASDDPVAGYPGPLGRDLAKDGARRGSELIAKLTSKPDQNVSFVQAEGDPSPAIHQRLEGGDYDLVVMGSHGHRGVRQWLLGGVTEQTVRHASCSVGIVKRPQ